MEKYSPSTNQQSQHQNQLLQNANSKRILAGVFGIILGHLGIHKFVLGYNNEGVILLTISLLGYATLCFLVGYFFILAAGIIGLVEGIIYLTKSDWEFNETYIKNKKSWF